MSRWVKQEDVIRKYAEMIADEAYWEHGVGNGKPDADDMSIAKEYYSDLPTIDLVRCGECKHWNTDGCREGCGECEWAYYMTKPDDFCSYGEREGV